MRLEQLQYLMAISEKQSINLAGKELNIAQQNISKAIKNLEDELNVTLLKRSSKGTTLTKEGRMVLFRAERIFSELNLLKKELENEKNGTNSELSGKIRIAYNNSFDYHFIMQIVKAFRAECPRVKVFLQQKALPNFLELLYTNEIDLAFFALESQYHLKKVIEEEQLKTIDIEYLFSDTQFAAVSRQSPICNQQTVAISALLKYPIVQYLNESTFSEMNAEIETNWLSQVLKDYGEPNIVMMVSALNLYLEAIGDDIGVGFLPKRSIGVLSERDLEKIKLVPTRPRISVDSYFAIRSDKKEDFLVKEFLNFLMLENIRKKE